MFICSIIKKEKKYLHVVDLQYDHLYELKNVKTTLK